jgi:hemerythrin
MLSDIQWCNEYSIDNAIIDSQHKWLLKLAGHLMEIEPLPDNYEEVKMIVLQLYQYMEFHFKREERLAKEARYPKYEAHVKAHQLIIKKMNDMMTSCVTIEELQPMLHEILSSWIHNHVAILDKDIAQFIQNR